MALNPDDTLLSGQYRILQSVGRGGFGYVYHAQDTHLGRDVAVKELIPGLIGDEDMLRRFLAEARTTMELTHERIVRTHHIFAEGPNYYIVMEYMAGGSLEARIREHGPAPMEQALRIAAQICDALAYAHRRGVVHCDLKPANVLFDTRGEAKVADFGIAHVSGEMLTRSWQTPAGFVAGTVPYMSPEQTEGVRDDPRVDIYALGAVLYRTLTGQTYVDFDQRETPRAQAENVLRIHSHAPQPPSALTPSIPTWLDAVVLRALAKQPEQRYATALDLRAALVQGASAAPQEPVATTPPSAPLSIAETRVAPRPGPAVPQGEKSAPDVPPPSTADQTPTPPSAAKARRQQATAPPSASAAPRERAQPARTRSRAWLLPLLGVVAALLVIGVVAVALLGGGGDTEAPVSEPTALPVAAATEARQSEPTPVKATATPRAEPARGTEPPAEPSPQPRSEGITSHEAPDCDYGGQMRKIEALDELTVQFTLCEPDVAFPAKVALPAFAIHSSESLEASGGGGDLVEHPNGTGPFRVAAWARGRELVLDRNPEYWGEPATADALIFRWHPEATVRLEALRLGEADVIDNPSPEDWLAIEKDPDLTLMPRDGLNTFYVGMNNWHAPFDDERVRRAIALGIDRDRIVEGHFPPGSLVASHFTPCAIPGGCAGEAWPGFDPDQARELLAEAGYPNGFQTRIFYRDVGRSYLPDPDPVARDLQEQLKNHLNIDTELVVMPPGEFLAGLDAGELNGLHLMGWNADYPDPTNFLDWHFGEGASDQFGDGIPEVHEALAAARSTPIQGQRDEFYAEANRHLIRHAPVVPVAHAGSAVAYRADVRGAHPSSLSNERFAAMDPGGRAELVWMQSAEPAGLYCADEVDVESMRACAQINESLLAYETGGTAVIPSLAEFYEASEDMREWTFHLRPGVKFHDGSELDAIDVVTSFVVQWDAEHPLHVGREGAFYYWDAVFGRHLNEP